MTVNKHQIIQAVIFIKKNREHLFEIVCFFRKFIRHV